MSATAGWYPDPGGGPGLYRYWDGKVWSAATSSHPSAPPPSQGLVGGAPSDPGQPAGGNPYATTPYGTGQAAYGSGSAGAYAQYQQIQKRRSPAGWWIAGAALVVVIIVVGVVAVRAITGGGLSGTGGLPGGQATRSVCPAESTESPQPSAQPNDGRVHGGPVSYPQLGSPWGAPSPDNRVPFGVDVLTQDVGVEANYDGKGNSWVASILVGELQAGDGFFTPQQGSEIVVKCILGKFYGNAPVTSDVKINRQTTIDGHDAWLVESQLSFDIPDLQTKGELLIVAIVSAGDRSGLYYASIPDTVPELVAPAREALSQLKVDG